MKLINFIGELGTGDGKTVRILGTRDARDY